MTTSSGGASAASSGASRSSAATTTTTRSGAGSLAGTPAGQQQPQPQQQQPASHPTLASSSVFQQVKQTQASLARLSRVHNLQQQQQNQPQPQTSQTNQSSHQHTRDAANPAHPAPLHQQQPPPSSPAQPAAKSTTFVDCLIRRFKNCFDEDFCTVPMFVVGGLSPGSDGTHLILPPCVSLGGQNMNRFAGPKNLRLLNSIRESCRSIEELDLGGNKFNDLIEVYKILQCTPNLKFLNLSENDLSRTSPVAVAAACSSAASASASAQTVPPTPTSTSTSTSSSLTPSSATPYGLQTAGGQQQQQQQPQHWSSGSSALAFSQQQQQQRNCLAPINQNQQAAMAGIRRGHSTLGQGASGSRAHHQTVSRVAEARRLAAAAAVAQTKKTSSSLASRLASSATAGSLSRPRRVGAGSRASDTSASYEHGSAGAGAAAANQSAGCALGAGQRHHGAPASTMHLARSLSSLSAKDVRAASSRRLSVAPRGCLKESSDACLQAAGAQALRTTTTSRPLVAGRAPAASSQTPTATGNKQPHQQQQQSQQQQQQSQQQQQTGTGNKQESTGNVTSSKLYGEPINESDVDIDVDVDMQAGEQQQQQQLPPQQQSSPNPTARSTAAASLEAAHCQAGSPQASPRPSSQHAGHHGGGSTTTTTTTTTRSALLVTRSNSMSLGSGGQSQNFRRTFESIRALALNNTGCRWRVVCSILSRMPNLEELHLSLNNYERIDLDPNEFKHHSLKRLYLCNNPRLTSWQELDKLLSAFPSLEALSMADCNISQIPENLGRARGWRKLCGLNINGWPIKEWPVIERLNQLPALVDLKCRNLEILSTIDEPRHHLIARLPKLQRLNGSEIEEREHAEKAFLRFFMANSHLERPSRFHELVQIHGEVFPVDVDVDLSPPSRAKIRVVFLNRSHLDDQEDILMSEDFITKLMDNVEPIVVQTSNNLDSIEMNDLAGQPNANHLFPCTEGNNNNNETACSEHETENDNKLVRLFKDDTQEVVAIDVDLRQSVRKFKASLSAIFGLDSQDLILYYIDREMVGLMGPELIKHNQKKLWNYNVQDGDQFIVEER